MKNNITLTQERLVRLFEEGVHFGVHNGGDFGDMHKAFTNKLEQLVVEQMHEDMKEQMQEPVTPNEIIVNSKLYDKLRKFFVNNKED